MGKFYTHPPDKNIHGRPRRSHTGYQVEVGRPRRSHTGYQVEVSSSASITSLGSRSSEGLVPSSTTSFPSFFPGALLVDLTSRVHHQIIPLIHVCRYTPVFFRWVVCLNVLIVSGSANTQSIKASLLVHFRNHEGSPPLFRSFFVPFGGITF